VSLTTLIGGLPVLELAASGDRDNRPRLTRALIAPGRAMMLLQLWAHLPGLGEAPLIEAPDLDEAARILNRRDIPFPGNAAYSFGGAILAPFANRMRGRLNGDRLDVETGDGLARLAPNGSGGTKPFAIHGLILDAPSTDIVADLHAAEGSVELGHDGAWPSVISVHIAWRLSAAKLALTVTARNIGPSTAPVGLGWHPYFRLPSGDRRAARLHVPAAMRTIVNDYTAVLPTGEVEPVAGTAYDFTAPEGRALADLYLDDCFLDLARDGAGEVLAEIHDPASGLRLQIGSTSPDVRAFQVYAPPDKAFVVVEPQFNLADPFSAVWRDRPTGMVQLEPDSEVAYQAQIALAPAG
jgi:aldose 1-epimerase